MKKEYTEPKITIRYFDVPPDNVAMTSKINNSGGIIAIEGIENKTRVAFDNLEEVVKFKY